MPEFELPPEDEEMVCFLVAYHLDLSSVMRRDIFDPETIHTLAKRVGSPERLKMLTLMTYADIGAVNPTALSPWKAENLWRVYLSTANYLNRSVDDDRFHSAGTRRASCAHSPAGSATWPPPARFSRRVAAALSQHARRRRDHPARGNGGATQV